MRQLLGFRAFSHHLICTEVRRSQVLSVAGHTRTCFCCGVSLQLVAEILVLFLTHPKERLSFFYSHCSTFIGPDSAIHSHTKSGQLKNEKDQHVFSQSLTGMLCVRRCFSAHHG